MSAGVVVDGGPGAGEEAGRWLAAAVRAGGLDLPLPGGGRTLERFRALARLGSDDLVKARLGEGHTDAVAILTEVGVPPEHGHVWGVWAADPGSVRASRIGAGWELTGRRGWCSGAGTCTRALVTAVADDGVRLFVLDPAAAGVRALAESWHAVGMAASDSRTLELLSVPAIAVGRPGVYIDRPGFWHGAIGVAACWYGGAAGVARALLLRSDLNPHALAHLGAIDAALSSARSLLIAAARRIDADPTASQARLAAQVRAVVEGVAHEVLDRVGRGAGAGPLCFDNAHARRVADLTVYLRQSHAEQDLAALGSVVSNDPDAASGWELPARSSVPAQPLNLT